MHDHASVPGSSRHRRSSRRTAAFTALLCLPAFHADAQIVLAGFTFDANAGPDRVVPLPGSQPEFDGQATGCVVSPVMPGKTLDESIRAVMLSQTLDNWVRGRAVMRLDFENNAIVNLPGPDVMVFELGQIENFDLSVLNEETCAWSPAISYSQSATGFAVPCAAPNDINARAIDLDDFGLPVGAIVRSLLLDNRGSPGSSTGADIMQVMAMNSTAPITATPCLLSFQQGVSGLSPVPYAGVEDTNLQSSAPTTDSSLAPIGWIDSSPYGTVLLRFNDLVGPAAWQIPPGATIRSAKLHVATGGGAANSGGNHPVHRLLQTWNPSTATFASSFGGNGIANDGIEAAVLADGVVGPMSTNAQQAVDVTSAVQAWVLGTTNHGICIRPASSDALGMHMSEATIDTLRPALSVVIETLAWVDLGGAKTGTNGTPHFEGFGVLAGGESIQLTLSNGVPSGSAIFVVGTGVLNAPFMGGIFVPTPDVVFAGLPLDATGGVAVPGVWPNGVPAGIDIVVQFWIPDAGLPLGFAASNARKSVTH